MTEAAAFGTYAPRGILRRLIGATRATPDSWLGRRAVIAVRRLVTPRLRGAPVDVEALGFLMRLRPYDNICEKRMLFAPQTFDPRELAILEGAIRPGFVFLDIGANVGAYALFVAARAGPSARIIAVEPQPEIFERLVFNIRLNAFATVKALDCAVSDKPGDVTLFLDPRNAGESSVKIVTSGAARSLRIASRTLLGLVEEEALGRVDAVKLDVEGAEDLVLEPFLNAAPAGLLPDLIIVEDGRERWQVDLERLLAEKGYGLVVKTRLNLVFRRGAGEGGDG